MPFTRPTLLELVERIIADMNSRITESDTFLRRSIARILGRAYAGVCHLLYGYLGYQKDQLAAFVESHGIRSMPATPESDPCAH